MQIYLIHGLDRLRLVLVRNYMVHINCISYKNNKKHLEKYE